MKKEISPKLIALTFGVLVMVFVIGWYIFAWTGPGENPPGGNVDAPINVGSTAQTKTGDFTVGGLTVSDATDCNTIDTDGSGVVSCGTDAVDDSVSSSELDGVCTTDDKILKRSSGTWDCADDATVPSGVIVMWSGLLSNIPSGWALCDGTNDTPNLLARFVQGVATAGTDPGTTGGATSKTTAGHVHSGPSHTHTGPSHTHTGPSHQHTLPISGDTNDNGRILYWKDTQYSGSLTPTKQAGTGTDHTSSVNRRLISDAAGTGDTGASGTGNTGASGTGNTGSKTDSISDIRPLYYDVAFIMKL